MSDKTYDTLKVISMIVGYLGVFAASMANIWGWEPYGSQVAASLAAASVLLGSILKASSDKYFEDHGIVEIDDQDDDGGDVEDE